MAITGDQEIASCDLSRGVNQSHNLGSGTWTSAPPRTAQNRPLSLRSPRKCTAAQRARLPAPVCPGRKPWTRANEMTKDVRLRTRTHFPANGEARPRVRLWCLPLCVLVLPPRRPQLRTPHPCPMPPERVSPSTFPRVPATRACAYHSVAGQHSATELQGPTGPKCSLQQLGDATVRVKVRPNRSQMFLESLCSRCLFFYTPGGDMGGPVPHRMQRLVPHPQKRGEMGTARNKVRGCWGGQEGAAVGCRSNGTRDTGGGGWGRVPRGANAAGLPPPESQAALFPRAPPTPSTLAWPPG